MQRPQLVSCDCLCRGMPNPPRPAPFSPCDPRGASTRISGRSNGSSSCLTSVLESPHACGPRPRRLRCRGKAGAARGQTAPLRARARPGPLWGDVQLRGLLPARGGAFSGTAPRPARRPGGPRSPLPPAAARTAAGAAAGGRGQTTPLPGPPARPSPLPSPPPCAPAHTPDHAPTHTHMCAPQTCVRASTATPDPHPPPLAGG
jgi:hypothetical protein